MSASFLPGAPHPQVASTDGKHLVPSQLSPSDSNYKLWHNTTADHGASDKCNMLLPVHFNQALPVKHAELFGWETGQQWQPFTSISATWSITADQCDNRGLIMKGVAKWKLLINRFPQTVQPLWPFFKKKLKEKQWRQKTELDLTPPQTRSELTAGILTVLICLIAFHKLLQQAALMPILMQPGQVNNVLLWH